MGDGQVHRKCKGPAARTLATPVLRSGQVAARSRFADLPTVEALWDSIAPDDGLVLAST